jgi:hypothetical protein
MSSANASAAMSSADAALVQAVRDLIADRFSSLETPTGAKFFLAGRAGLGARWDATAYAEVRDRIARSGLTSSYGDVPIAAMSDAQTQAMLQTLFPARVHGGSAANETARAAAAAEAAAAFKRARTDGADAMTEVVGESAPSSVVSAAAVPLPAASAALPAASAALPAASAALPAASGLSNVSNVSNLASRMLALSLAPARERRRELKENSTCESSDELYLALRHAFFSQRVPLVGAELAKELKYDDLTVVRVSNSMYKGANPVRELVEGLWVDGHRTLGKRLTAKDLGTASVKPNTGFLPSEAGVKFLVDNLEKVKATRAAGEVSSGPQA